MGFHELISSMLNAVPPWEYEAYPDEDPDDYVIYEHDYYEDAEKIADHILKHGVKDIPDMKDQSIFAENMIAPLLEAWIQKPTPQIEAKFIEALWEATSVDIKDWLRRKMEYYVKQEIIIDANILSRWERGEMVIDVEKKYNELVRKNES